MLTGLGSGAAKTPGNSLRPPALWGLLRHQSSGESATSTSTTLHPQSSTDSERHHSSLDPQSSYDSVSDYPTTSDTDDFACNVTGLYPRGWAVSGSHVISGQPLSVRAALNQLHYPGQSCSIVTNPLEDLWQEEESRRAADDGCVGRQSVACLNGPSLVSYEVKSKTLPRVKKGCGHPHSCLSGNVICQGVQPSQPGKREQDMVQEAAQYYQRALDAAHIRHEGLKRDQSSASDDDFSFSGSRDGGVVTQEPIKYPVRIRSEADLTRATSIIRDNLANIIQNYLFKPGASPEFQPLVSHLALDHPTVKLVGTKEEEIGSQFSTSGSTESKEGSSPPPLVVAGEWQTQVTPLALFHKVPFCRSEASPQHPLPKARSSSPGSTIQMVCLPTSHEKGELSSGMSPCVVRKEKQPSTATSKFTGKSSTRGDKRLTKSEEIQLPPFIRENHIDVPIIAEDDLTSNSSSTASLGHTVEYPQQQHTTTTYTKEREENKFDAALKSIEEDTKCVTATFKKPIQIKSITEETPFPNMVAKIQEIALVSVPDTPIDSKIQETVLSSDIKKTVMAPSTAVAVAQKIQNAAVISPSAQSKLSIQDTSLSHTVMAPTAPDASMISTQPITSVPKIDFIPDITMIPPTPDTDTDSVTGTVMTSVTPDMDLTPVTPDKDITQAMDMIIESQEITKTSTTIEKDILLLTQDVKITPKVTADSKIAMLSNLTQTLQDMSQEAPGTDMVPKESDLDVNPLNITTMTRPATSGTGRNSECVRIDTQVGKDETRTCDDAYSPEAVVTIVHDGCISPVVENNLSWEGSSPASESQGDSIQQPRCLKNTHKLNTKSSTASESSFESLPYRMLTSQPESLTEDVATDVSIELTCPPPDTDRLRAARLELIRQERIHAISLMSTVTTDSEEGYIWAASLEEQPFGSPMVANNSQETLESPVSGMEVTLQEPYIEHSTKSKLFSPTSPTESAPESGFSSLQETMMEGSGRGARSGVCLSKSKDSLDLTDGDRCPGTDTFSDDMETLSSSAGEATLMESGPVSQRASPRNSVSDSIHHDSGLAVPIQEVSQHEGKMPKELESSSGLLMEEKAFRCLSDDSNKYKMKTNESLPSKDTTVTRPSLDDYIPKLEYQSSQENLSEENPLETQEGRLSQFPHLHSRSEADKGIKEAKNSYCVVEDKWEPHHTWPPGVNFTSHALHTSIADKLRLLSESEADASIKSYSRSHRSKRAMSTIAGNTLGFSVSEVEPHLRVDAHGSFPKRSYTSDCKQTKPHSCSKNEELSPTITSSIIPVRLTNAKPHSTAPISGHGTIEDPHSSVPPVKSINAKTYNTAPISGQSTIENFHSTVPDPDQSTNLKTHSSAFVPDQYTTVHLHSSGPVSDQSTIKTCRNAPVPVRGQYITVKTYNNPPVSGQSIVRTHIAPDPVQSTDMKTHNNVFVPGHSTSVKTHNSTSVPGQVSFAKTLSSPSDLVHSITVKSHNNAFVPSQSIIAHTHKSVLGPSQSTIARIHNNVSVSGQSVIAKTDCRVLAHVESTITEPHTSGTSFTPPTVSKADSNDPTLGHPSIASSNSSHTSIIISTTDACSSTTTNSSKPSRHSSKNGVSDLEDEVFLPPPENYILNGHPIIYCPRVDMANQIRPSSPKITMPLCGVTEVGQEGIYQNSSLLPDSSLPTQHYTPPLTPHSLALNSVPSLSMIIPTSSSSSSSITVGLSSFSSLPDGAMTTPGTQQTGTTTAAVREPIVPTDSQWSSTALKQQEMFQQRHVDSAGGTVKDACHANHLPPTPQSGSPASINLQQTTASTTITTSSCISSTTTTTTISSVTEVAKSPYLEKERPENQPKASDISREEKKKEPPSKETNHKSVWISGDVGDGKPRLQRMAHLERTDTSSSPTSTKIPTPSTNPLTPGSKCENVSKSNLIPAHQHPVKRNGNFELIIRNINDTAVKVASDEDIDQHPREGAEKTTWNQGSRETRRGGSEEAPLRSHIPNLRKYGSEELSRATPDSYCSSNSKSYLESDLDAVSSFRGAGGSLELLEGSLKDCWPSQASTSITAAQSQELARCEQVSLKSQGSLDKFPYFDQLIASQRQVNSRRKVVSVDDSGTGKSEHMHRSFTLPGSLASSRKDDKKKEKEEKGKKKKKEKEGAGGGEKKSAIMSLKGLLRRNKPKEKEKEGTQERLSSPSLFRRLERRSKSGSTSTLSDSSIRQPHPGNSTSSSPVDSTSRSPLVVNGKIRPVISSPVALQQPAPIIAAPITTSTIAAPNRGIAISCSDSESAPSSTPASPQRRVSLARGGCLGGQPSPRLYKHVLTRNLSSSQESIDSSILSSAQSSPQSSPHGSPKRCVIPPSASSLSLPAVRELSPVVPVMGTRALRGSSNSFSVTIGFRPQIERRRGQRTVSEGADLNCVSLSPGPRHGEGSRVLTQLGKRSSSMEILVCGKIREHYPEPGSSLAGPRIPFSREGSFRLHREISVETLFEIPEGGGAGGSQEDYRRYLDHVHATRHGSCSSLAEEPSSAPEPLSRQRVRKYSVPQGMHLSGMREAAMSNPNLQRSSSPLVRGMSHSSTFSSPLRRPSSATSAYSPAKRGLCSSTGGPLLVKISDFLNVYICEKDKGRYVLLTERERERERERDNKLLKKRNIVMNV